jgi:hypothetical protein
MTKIPVRFGLCLLFLALVARPAVASVTIDPPAGWKPLDVSSMMVRLEAAWAAPASDDFAQNITLLKEAAPGLSLDDYVKLSENQLRKTYQNVVLSLDKTEKCGAVSMQHLKYDAPFGTHMLSLEQILVPDSGSFYVVTYTRLVSQPALPEASQALLTACDHLSGGIT